MNKSFGVLCFRTYLPNKISHLVIYALICLALCSPIHLQAIDSSQDEIILGPIIIESDRLDPTRAPILRDEEDLEQGSINVGIGAKNISATENIFGLRSVSMNGTQKINQEIWTNIEPTTSNSSNLTKFYSSKRDKQDIKKRKKIGVLLGNQKSIVSSYVSEKFLIEGLYLHDQRKLHYLNQNNHIFDPNKHTLGVYTPDKKAYGLRLGHHMTSLGVSSFVDGARQTEQVFFQKDVKGKLSQQNIEGNLVFAKKKWGKSVLMVSQENKSFESWDALLFSKKWNDRQLGLSQFFILPQSFRLKLNGHLEFLHQSEGRVSKSFKRQLLISKLSWGKDRSFWWGKPYVFLSMELASDQEESLKQNWQAYELTAQYETPQWKGLATYFRFKNFQLTPNVIHLFGDGTFLKPQVDLPMEKGYRALLGEKWQYKGLKFSVEGFYEFIENQALVQTVSPQAAKAMAVSGVSTQGHSIKLEYKYENWNIYSEYQYQKAINTSKIRWQQGKALPARVPIHINVGTDIELGDHWLMKGQYTYQSGHFTDLANNWYRKWQHNLMAEVKWKYDPYTIGLKGNHLLGPGKEKEEVFQGKSGSTLLNPNIQKKEILLFAEVQW